MLRGSATATDRPVDTAAIRDGEIDSKLPGGSELLAFTTALVESRSPDDPELVRTRDALVATLDAPAAARAATVAGNFEMMNRLLDAAGVPVPSQMMDMGRELGVV